MITIMKKTGISLTTLLFLVSCVTINIYFPAAAAEKAADRIIEDIWGTEGQPSPDQTDSAPEQQSSNTTSWGLAVLDWFIPPASAAEPNININSAAVKTIQSRMKQRHSKLKPFYDNGAIGLTDKGYVAQHQTKKVALKDRNKLKALIAAENKDRKAMYAEIARVNGHPEWQADIQATFARRWVDKAAKGWWYQSKGQWRQK